MAQYRYEKPCFSFMNGKLGQLQTLKRFLVTAGEKYEIEIDAIFRLAPLRTFMARDCKVDLFFFFVPHRHVYGQDWIDFINEGPDETVTFPASAVAADDVGYVGTPTRTGALPLHLCAGYAKIWNRYFKSPNDSSSTMSETAFLQTDEKRLTGNDCARLPTIWTSGIEGNLTDADREVAVSGGAFDIVDLQRTQAQYWRKSDREWYGQFYDDVLRTTFGGGASTDADERPTVLYRNSAWLSGYDVDGTSGDSLGDFAGKSFGRMRCKMPRRHFGEHGTIWVMALLRFPTIHTLESHYLDLLNNPSYLQIGGDAALIEAEPPADMDADEFFAGGGANSLGTFPSHQWHRYEPSVVSVQLQQQGIYPFLNTVPSSFETAFYSTGNEYNNVFKSLVYQHWLVQCALYCTTDTHIPGPKTSIYAGVR